jgi:hypothetical protein
MNEQDMCDGIPITNDTMGYTLNEELKRALFQCLILLCGGQLSNFVPSY